MMLRGVFYRSTARILSHADILKPVIEGGIEVGCLFSRPCLYGLTQVAASRALLQRDKWRGLFQLFPHTLQLASHAGGEESGEVAAGEIIFPLPSYLLRPADVVATARFIQRHLHIVSK